MWRKLQDIIQLDERSSHINIRYLGISEKYFLFKKRIVDLIG